MCLYCDVMLYVCVFVCVCVLQCTGHCSVVKDPQPGGEWVPEAM